MILKLEWARGQAWIRRQPPELENVGSSPTEPVPLSLSFVGKLLIFGAVKADVNFFTSLLFSA